MKATGMSSLCTRTKENIANCNRLLIKRAAVGSLTPEAFR